MVPALIPVINSITPETGHKNIEVVIAGENFGIDTSKVVVLNKAISADGILYTTEDYARIRKIEIE